MFEPAASRGFVMPVGTLDFEAYGGQGCAWSREGQVKDKGRIVDGRSAFIDLKFGRRNLAAGLLVSLVLGISPVAAMAGDAVTHGDPSVLSADDLFAQRAMVARVLSEVKESTSLVDLEAIVGQKLTEHQEAAGAVPPSKTRLYYLDFKYPGYSYWVYYWVDAASGRGVSIEIGTSISDDIRFDDAGCLNLGNVKSSAIQAGWLFDASSAYSLEAFHHVINAAKGSLRLKAMAAGVPYARNFSQKDYDDWFAKYGARGCVQTVTIVLSNGK